MALETFSSTRRLNHKYSRANVGWGFGGSSRDHNANNQLSGPSDHPEKCELPPIPPKIPSWIHLPLPLSAPRIIPRAPTPSSSSSSSSAPVDPGELLHTAAAMARKLPFTCPKTERAPVFNRGIFYAREFLVYCVPFNPIPS